MFYLFFHPKEPPGIAAVIFVEIKIEHIVN